MRWPKAIEQLAGLPSVAPVGMIVRRFARGATPDAHEDSRNLSQQLHTTQQAKHLEPRSKGGIVEVSIIKIGLPRSANVGAKLCPEEIRSQAKGLRQLSCKRVYFGCECAKPPPMNPRIQLLL